MTKPYDDLRRQMDSLCGAINGDYGELDWMPVRYIHRNVARKRLPGLYRASRVALVTPLRDGMNLVGRARRIRLMINVARP